LLDLPADESRQVLGRAHGRIREALGNKRGEAHG